LRVGRCGARLESYNVSIIRVTTPAAPRVAVLWPVPARGRERPMQAVKGFSVMEKSLCWASIATGGLVLLLFLLNLMVGIPFGKGISLAVHIVVIVASGLLVYLGWNAMRDLR
jgi:hypothetical protein